MPDARLPESKGEAQRLLRKFGYTGLKIESIEEVHDERVLGRPCVIGRIFALTQPVLHEDNTMRRQARTYLFHFTDDEVMVSEHDGWVV
jgi:hypothetical protein